MKATKSNLPHHKELQPSSLCLPAVLTWVLQLRVPAGPLKLCKHLSFTGLSASWLLICFVSFARGNPLPQIFNQLNLSCASCRVVCFLHKTRMTHNFYTSNQCYGNGVKPDFSLKLSSFAGNSAGITWTINIYCKKFLNVGLWWTMKISSNVSFWV